MWQRLTELILQFLNHEKVQHKKQVQNMGKKMVILPLGPDKRTPPEAKSNTSWKEFFQRGHSIAT